MHHVKALKTGLRAPASEVRPGIVERIAEFDEHVQRPEQTKDVLAPGIVNKGFNRDQRAAGWKSVVSRADEKPLLFEIPVVEDHAHRDDVGFGQGISEEVTGSRADAVAEPCGRDVFLRDRLHRRQVEGSATKIRMSFRDFNRKQASRPAGVAQGLEV